QQQYHESIYPVRERLAHSHDQFACEHTSDRTGGADRRVLRDGHTRSAKLMNLPDYGIKVGNPADVTVLEATSPRQAVAELREPIAVFKRGRRTVTRHPTELHHPV